MANQSGGGSGDQKKKSPGINDMILGGMRSRSGTETTKWINNLTSENMEEMVQSAVEPTVEPVQNALPAQFAHPSISQTQVKWVDKLFDLFQQYEVEFNRAVTDPNLRIEIERPVITADLISKMQGSDHYHYSGRLHTRFWSLAIRGNLSNIEGYIIPSDHYIGFESNVSAYVQFFQFVPVWDGELKWSFEKGAFSIAQLPPIAKQIFGQLVRVGRGESEPDERFGASVGARQGYPAGGHKIPELADTNNQTEHLARHSSVFGDEDPLASSSPQEFPHAQSTQHATATPSRAVSAPAPAPAQAPASQPAAPASGDVDLNSAFDQLTVAMGKELERLSRAGAKAFESHDFALVEKLVKRTAKFKGMHDQMLSTIQQWKRELDSDQ